MSNLWQFNVASLLAGGNSPYSAGFEGIATRTLEGIQGAQIALVYPRTDAFSWDGNGDQEMVDRPRAQMDFSWVFASGVNEAALGFTTTPSGGTSALAALVTQERNYYLLINQDNVDSVGYSGLNSRVLALGNAVVTHYDFTAAVGQPSMVNARVEGLNLLVQSSGSGQILPALNKQSGTAVTGVYSLAFPTRTIGDYFESAPHAIQLTFNTGSAIGVLLSGQNACPVESFSFSIDLARQDVKDMGWAYPAVRPIQWPVTVAINADVHLSEFQLDALNRNGCPDSGYSFTVGFKNSCSTLDPLTFQFNGAKLETENVAVQVGGGTARATFAWSLKINDINRSYPGFFMNASGTPYSSIVFPQVDRVAGVPPLTFTLGTSCFLSIVSGPGFLSANNVYVSDEAASVVVRATATDGSDIEDVTVTVS